MKCAAFELEQEKFCSKNSQKEKETEEVQKADQQTFQRDLKVTSEKIHSGNSGANFFFQLSKMLQKVFVYKVAEEPHMWRSAHERTIEGSKKSNKLTITSHPPNKENDKNSEYLSTEMPQLRVQILCI